MTARVAVKYSEFGQVLRTLRRSRRLRQKQLADAVGVSQTAVSEWEHGYTFPSDPVLLARLAEVLDPDCTELADIRLALAAGVLRECSLKRVASEYSKVDHVFEVFPVEWTDRLAEILAERVAGRIAEVMAQERQTILDLVSHERSLVLEAVRSRDQLIQDQRQVIQALLDLVRRSGRGNESDAL